MQTLQKINDLRHGFRVKVQHVRTPGLASDTRGTEELHPASYRHAILCESLEVGGV